MARDLPKEAALYGLEVKALVVVGPYGRVLLAEPREDDAGLRYADFGCGSESKHPGFDALDAAYQALSPKLELTYSGYSPTEDIED